MRELLKLLCKLDFHDYHVTFSEGIGMRYKAIETCSRCQVQRISYSDYGIFWYSKEGKERSMFCGLEEHLRSWKVRQRFANNKDESS